MRIVRTIFVAAVALFGLSSAAMAEDWQLKGEFGWFGVGKTQEVGENHFFWVGEFSGTFFNDEGLGSPLHHAAIRCPGYADLDFGRGAFKWEGRCVATDPDGDKAYASWVLPTSADPHRGSGTFEWTGGTGKYAGISGSNTLVGVTQVNFEDGMAAGYAIWNR